MRVIAAPGDPAPGGGTFTLIRHASISSAGDVAFVAGTTAPDESSAPSSAVFKFSAGELTEVVRVGDAAPLGGQFRSFGVTAINATGMIALLASTTTSSGVFLSSGGTMQPLAIDRATLPGIGTLGFAFDIAINNRGLVVFASNHSDDDDNAIYIVTEGQLVPVAGFGVNTTVGHPIRSADSPSLNDAGQVAFAVHDFDQDDGLYLWSNGTVSRLLGAGDTLPTYGGSSSVVGSIHLPSINANGDIVFLANGTSAQQLGLYEWNGVALTPRVLVQGEDGIFSGVGSPSLNASGAMAFDAFLRGDSFRDVYLQETTELRSIGRGLPIDAAPRIVDVTPARVTDRLEAFNVSTFPGGVAVMDLHGALRLPVSFVQASFATSDSLIVLPSADFGVTAVWSVTLSGGVREIVRTGTLVPNGSQLTSIQNLSVNARGDVAFVGRTGNFQQGLYFIGPSGLTEVISATQIAVRLGAQSATIESVAVNDHGHIAFGASGFPATGALFVWKPDGVSMIARDGDPGPEGRPIKFTGLGQSIAFNDSGVVVTRGVTPPLIPSQFPVSGLYMINGPDVALRTLLREGDPVPGGILRVLESFSVDDANRVALASQIDSGAGATSARVSNILLWEQGELVSLMRAGDALPGGGVISTVRNPVQSFDGRVLFSGTTSALASVVFAAVPRAVCTTTPCTPNPSPDGTELPPAGQLTDSHGDVWTLGDGYETLRNGGDAGGGYARSLLWSAGTLYAYGWDDQWWKWAGTGWAVYGPSRPGSGSPDGTQVPPGDSVRDTAGSVWTLGVDGETLRDGVHAAGGYARSLLWSGGSLYAFGFDDQWWRWDASGWVVDAVH